MSPEYTVVVDKKTGRYEIKAGLLPNEVREEEIHALWAPVAANSFLKRNKKINAEKRLQKILPKGFSEKIVQAVEDGRDGYGFKFRKQKNGKYKIIRE